MEKLKYIDLFSGCGGLSLGFESENFELVFAVEKSNMAGETFYHNLVKPLKNKEDWLDYLDKTPKEQLDNHLFIGETLELLENDSLLKDIKKETEVDLIVGGPPCQGFSMAGKRNPKDYRNQLPWQFLEFVDIFKPKMVLMENVLGIRQNFNKHNVESPFQQIKKVLENGFGEGVENQYIVQELQLNAMHFGVPQHRPRVFLMALRKDLVNNTKLVVDSEIWLSEYFYKENKSNEFCPTNTIKTEDEIIPIKDAIEDLYSNSKSFSKYIKNINNNSNFQNTVKGNSKELNNHIERKHSENVVSRFRLYQYFSKNNISNKVLNLVSKYSETKDLTTYNKIIEELSKGKIPAISPDGTLIAETNEDLLRIILNLGTKKHTQRALDLNKPAPTVVTTPDDVIHPIFPRTMTVREQARFQSFPDYFEFKSKETTGGKLRKIEVPQYTQVGNAVPPLLAKEIAKTIKNILSKV